MNLKEMTAICNILNTAKANEGETPESKYFDMQHDILYIPWNNRDDRVAQELEEVGCHWDEEANSWAHF